MKNLRKLLFVLFFVVAAMISFAQSPPHPNGGSAPGSGSTPVGGGAPLSGGLLIMLSLAVGYSARKLYEIRRNSLE